MIFYIQCDSLLLRKQKFKIASVCYANTDSEINSYSKTDLSSFLPTYKNVVDVNADYISISDYRNGNGMQSMSVSARLHLIRCVGETCVSNDEVLSMKLIKSASCKSQLVCAPSLSRCGSCGASISIFAGKKCPNCGHVINLEEQDWVIVEYSAE